MKFLIPSELPFSSRPRSFIHDLQQRRIDALANHRKQRSLTKTKQQPSAKSGRKPGFDAMQQLLLLAQGGKK